MIVNRKDRADLIRRVAFEVCKFANGAEGCHCSHKIRARPCESAEHEAAKLISMVEMAS